MRKFNSYAQIHIIYLILSGIVLSSCVGAVQKFPTMTPTPTKTVKPQTTSIPTPTSTPTNTAAPEPTPTNTAAPELTPTRTLIPPQVSVPIATSRSPLRLGAAIPVQEAGFSFQPLIGYEERYQPGQVTLTSEDEDIILSLIGSPIRRIPDLEKVLNRFIEVISETFQEFDTGEPYPYTIGGSVGLAVDVNGEWSETPIEGRITIVSPNEEQLFYAFAISANGDDGRGWEPKGRQAFDAVIDSISFFEPGEQQD